MYFLVVALFVCGVLFSNTPQRRLLSMVFIFLNFSILLIVVGMEFISLIVLIIYVGAISVLFLFIIMFINLRQKDAGTDVRDVILVLVSNFWLSSFGLCFILDLDIFGNVLSESFFKDLVQYGELLNVFQGSIEDFFVGNSFIFLETLWLNQFSMNIELEQLGFLLWVEFNFLILLAGFILISSIVGCVSILRGIFFYNFTKKQFFIQTKRDGNAV